jgi:hypothetical protein
MSRSKTDDKGQSQSTALITRPDNVPAHLKGSIDEMQSRIQPGDLSPIRIVNGGSGSPGFVYRVEDEKEILQEVFCIILDEWSSRRFYANPEPVEGERPLCQTIDDLTTPISPESEELRDERFAKGCGEKCEGCRHAQWGSALKGGRGKACSERRNFLLIRPRSKVREEIVTKEQGFRPIPMLFSCSPTQIADWQAFISRCCDEQIPYPAAILRITSTDDSHRMRKGLRIEFVRYLTEGEHGLIQGMREKALASKESYRGAQVVADLDPVPAESQGAEEPVEEPEEEPTFV